MDINFYTFWFYIPQAWRMTIFAALFAFVISLFFPWFEFYFTKVLRILKTMIPLLVHHSLKILFYLTDFLMVGLYKLAPFKSKSFIATYENITRKSPVSVSNNKTTRSVKQFKFSKMHSLLFTIFFMFAIFTIMTWMPESQLGKKFVYLEAEMYSQFNIPLIERHIAKQKLSDFYVYLFEDDSIAESNEVSASTSLSSLPLLQLKNEYEGVNLRFEPTTAAEIVSVIDKGEKFYYLGTDDVKQGGVTWYEVETEDGHTGWVSDYIVEFKD